MSPGASDPLNKLKWKNEMKTFAERIIYLMKVRGFTSYAALARKSGVSSRKISEYARGVDDNPKLQTLAKLSIVGLSLHPSNLIAPMYNGKLPRRIHSHNIEIGDLRLNVAITAELPTDD